MIGIYNKDHCSGCTACANICPKKAIQMKYDNEGFYYPIIDSDLCVNCGACEKVCPYENEYKERSDQLLVYGCQNLDEKMRQNSTSGGMFSAIAEYVLSKEGVVFGAGYDLNMHVVHKYIETYEEIQKLQGSKYVQSELGDTFLVIKKFLEEGRYVLFTGTPCQVEGLLYFLKECNIEKLITADVKCYGVPSSELFDMFQQNLSCRYNTRIKNFYFRDKKYGYSGVNVKAILEDGNSIEDKLEIKTYSKTMFSKMGLRRSCYSCKFTDRKKISDFTLGDIWTIRDFDKRMDDDKGTTCVEINTQKGISVFNEIEKRGTIRKVKIAELSGNALEKYQKGLKRNYSMDGARRKEFFDDMHNMPYEELMKKHFGDTIKNKVDNYAKPIINSIPGLKIIFRIKKLKNAGKVRYFD